MTITPQQLEAWKLSVRDLMDFSDVMATGLTTDPPRLNVLVMGLQALRDTADNLLEEITDHQRED